MDAHYTIDVCGVGEKYIPYTHRDNVLDLAFTSRNIKYKYNVVRGIEVKVSRNDFKTGFMCTGCNYHYLMIPEGLVYSYQIPKHVGIIKVDPTRFETTFEPAPTFRFFFKGLRVTRKPRKQEIKQYQIDNAISNIAKRSTRELINRVAKNLTEYQK